MKQNTAATPEAGAGVGLSFETRYFGRAYVVTNTYYQSQNLAVELVYADGEPIATLSVNLPEFVHLLGEKEFFAKTWSENAEIAEDALASGLFRETGRGSGGILDAPIWRMR